MTYVEYKMLETGVYSAIVMGVLSVFLIFITLHGAYCIYKEWIDEDEDKFL